ncbi:hypothetical protein D8674_022271 [Pyrus ussuriensis x Pyrus communis]|uniref:Aminotransferase-like plant mobile domain-containing protein n=1 Tax=Pyrus ussuriensis x Pyrus communis TaxID=2448454 RepID=A0A5N5GLK3_9ROSA|nr:hypothetical protein D8674_022271 [Pyrus ussuriensis x Pyrus communis]
MASVHQSTWKEAGIYEANLNSTYQIRRQTGLVHGFAEKWCPETTTITLEDIMVLGGFSVLGDSVLSPLDTAELKEIEDKLLAQRKEMIRSRAMKATTSSWLNRFINGGHQLKHEAFLVYWLLRYVFNDGGIIHRPVFSIAIHLARGTRIALAPAVLSSVYNDLGALKKATVDSNQLENLRPENPNHLNNGEPRMARWDKVDGRGVENLRKVLDLAGEEFLWRPYALDIVENWHLPKYYPPREMWVSVGPDSDDELQSFLRCLRLSEADVSTTYIKWLKKSLPCLKDASEAASPQKKKAKSIVDDRSVLMANHSPVPPGCPPECNNMEAEDPMDEDDKLTISEFLRKYKKHKNVKIIEDGDSEKLSGQVPNLESKIARERSFFTKKSDKDIESVVGNECASSRSLFGRRALEIKARIERENGGHESHFGTAETWVPCRYLMDCLQCSLALWFYLLRRLTIVGDINSFGKNQLRTPDGSISLNNLESNFPEFISKCSNSTFLDLSANPLDWPNTRSGIYQSGKA